MIKPDLHAYMTCQTLLISVLVIAKMVRMKIGVGSWVVMRCLDAVAYTQTTLVGIVSIITRNFVRLLTEVENFLLLIFNIFRS